MEILRIVENFWEKFVFLKNIVSQYIYSRYDLFYSDIDSKLLLFAECV
jgi:hypothetical protein